MRPERVLVSTDEGAWTNAVPIDVALEKLDAELEAAGAQARRMLNGKRQPTRYFTNELRQVLLEALAAQPAAGARR
jgi:hypothetical protein